MSEWLVAGGQRAKMQLIGEHYQNTLGTDNSIDYLESITDFFSQVDTGLSIIELRLQEGTKWVDCWDKLNAICYPRCRCLKVLGLKCSSWPES